MIDAAGQGVADLLAGRTDVSRTFKFSQHRVQPFRDVPGDAIEQKCRRTEPRCPQLPHARQGAVEQDGRGGRVRGPAACYAGHGTPGNHRAAVPFV
jgi:hypothetical protein